MGRQQTEGYWAQRDSVPGRRHLQRRATHLLRDGEWCGERCFIIGGGPSVGKMDLSPIVGEPNVIGINMGYRLAPTTMALVCSINLLGRLVNEPDWINWRGPKLTLESFIWNAKQDFGCRVLEVAERDVTWGTSLETGFPIPGNGGALAINLAAVLGADPIYLIGFDMRGEGGRTANYHKFYRTSLPSARYTDYAREIARCVGKANVINLSPGSALDCFPRSTLEEVCAG